MSNVVVPTVADELMDFTVIATSPADMEKGQRSLILWAARKIQAIKSEIAEVEEQLAIAVQHKWGRGGWQNQIRKHKARLEFYKKIKAALEAGYYIVPPFPVEVFAIRRSDNTPTYAGHNVSHRNSITEERAEILPVGEGDYYDPRPKVGTDLENETKKDGSVVPVKKFYADTLKAVDFPFKLAKPEILGKTAEAMALKIFDRLGILPGTRRKPDPIICGQIIIPGQERWFFNPGVVNFFVAWWLDTSTLPK